MTRRAVEFGILGGGVSAWACAAALRSRGSSCAVLSRDDGARAVGEYVPPEGVGALTGLGLGGVLDNPAHRRCPGTLSLWGEGAPIRRDALLQPGGRALCVDRKALESDLRARAIAAGAEHIELRATPAVSGASGVWRLDLRRSGIASLDAGFLVDATGRAATLSRALGARVVRDDGLAGLALFCAASPVADGALRIESLPDGWCYAAPLSGDRLVAVFLTDVGLLPRGSGARRALALARVAQSRLVGPLVRAEPRLVGFRGLPAGSQVTEPSCGLGWAAIGDAAMAFDPLASAGLSKALLDVREAVVQITADPAALAAVRAGRYAGYRRGLRDAYRAETRFSGPFWEARRRRAPVTNEPFADIVV